MSMMGGNLLKIQTGFSLPEMMMALAVASFLFLVMGSLFNTTSSMMTTSQIKTNATSKVQSAMDKVETALLNAVLFTKATPTEVEFIADINTDPAFDPNTDWDADGIPNGEDADRNGDGINYNLKDDDDDKDGKIDMQWRISLDNVLHVLTMDYSKNEEPWGNHKQVILPNVYSTALFNFMGSNNPVLSAKGASIFGSTSTVSEVTIDHIADATHLGYVGNGNSSLDTQVERDLIVTVGVNLDCDLNGDGKVDSKSSCEVMSPGLYLRRQQ